MMLPGGGPFAATKNVQQRDRAAFSDAAEVVANSLHPASVVIVRSRPPGGVGGEGVWPCTRAAGGAGNPDRMPYVSVPWVREVV